MVDEHQRSSVYCFRGLPAGAKIALVSANNLNDQNDTIASVYTNNTGGIVGCDVAAGDRFRVRTYDVSAVGLANSRLRHLVRRTSWIEQVLASCPTQGPDSLDHAFYIAFN